MRDFSIDIIWAKVQMAIAAIGGWLGYFLGGMDGLLIALVVLMVVDYVSGVLVAIVSHNLSSAIGFKGICRKVMMLLLVGVANIVDVHLVGTGSALRTAVVTFLATNEGVSVCENASRLGLPIPEKLKEVLVQLHKGSNPALPEGDKGETDKDDTDTNQQ